MSHLSPSHPAHATDQAGPPLRAEPTDEALVERAVAGDPATFELLMRRNNQRVYRTIRAVLRDGAEIEDAMQQAYLSAFAHLRQFQGTSRFSTWLCRIAFNEALARLRQRRERFVSIDTGPKGSNAEGSNAGVSMAATLKAPGADPEHEVGGRELAVVLEHAIDQLPDIYRAVLVLRQIEGLTTAETSEVLSVEEEVVKTRLHRARALLRTALEQRLGEQLDHAFAFGAERCDRVVAAVLARL